MHAKNQPIRKLLMILQIVETGKCVQPDGSKNVRDQRDSTILPVCIIARTHKRVLMLIYEMYKLSYK